MSRILILCLFVGSASFAERSVMGSWNFKTKQWFDVSGNEKEIYRSLLFKSLEDLERALENRPKNFSNRLADVVTDTNFPFPPTEYFILLLKSVEKNPVDANRLLDELKKQHLDPQTKRWMNAIEELIREYSKQMNWYNSRRNGYLIPEKGLALDGYDVFVGKEMKDETDYIYRMRNHIAALQHFSKEKTIDGFEPTKPAGRVPTLQEKSEALLNEIEERLPKKSSLGIWNRSVIEKGKSPNSHN